MLYPRFFVLKENIKKNYILIKKEELHYLKNVLRIKPGKDAIACDEEGKTYHLILEKITSKEAYGKIIKLMDNTSSILQITLAQSLPKADKMDFIIKSTASLGITKFIPLITERTIKKIPEDKYPFYQKRWEKIAKESARQSERTIIPSIEKLQTLTSINFTLYDKIIVPWEEEKKYHLRDLLKQHTFKKAIIFIGPEGGFSKNEVESLKNKGGISISLGEKILKTEIAGLSTLIMLLYEQKEIG